MMILYFIIIFNVYGRIVLDIPPLMPFSTINSISISINSSNFSSIIFKAGFHANPGVERNCAGCN